MSRAPTETHVTGRPTPLLQFAVTLWVAVLGGCGASSHGAANDQATPGPGTPRCSRAVIAADMEETLLNLQTDADFSLYLETGSGAVFTFDGGDSTMATSYESASTSKWVTATVILRLVDQGYLSLASRPQDLISGWDIERDDPLYAITLAQLLSFTSGLTDEPLCLNAPAFDFESCVLQIANLNSYNGKRPGEEFFYASTHLQVAGLMAVRAVGASGWRALFRDFRQQTGLFPTSRYDLPSAYNPRLAGGMHWTGTEYVDFLRALEHEALLSDGLTTQMYSDQIASASIGWSPARAATGEDWHYGFGHWLECDNPVFNCRVPSYHSSPGAYGAYPLVNVTDDFFGIVARQGTLGTFAEGKAVFDSVRTDAEAWATCDND